MNLEHFSVPNCRRRYKRILKDFEVEYDGKYPFEEFKFLYGLSVTGLYILNILHENSSKPIIKLFYTRQRVIDFIVDYNIDILTRDIKLDQYSYDQHEKDGDLEEYLRINGYPHERPEIDENF